ncbi:MAG: mechanosensitive ion channel family protein [Candidatus Rokubacteria bacterium]|nr:mechanosensitive ion channel family protein [Candidatus Rokubacteria bacterium]MBI3105884.1 mechanosensitive ion channel family protein [Candidatus Rokubacteria bacterium]
MNLWPAFWAASAFIAATVTALALRRIILAGTRRWTPQAELLSAGADAIRVPSLWWCALLGLYVGNEVLEEISPLPTRWHDHLRLFLEIAVILSITLAVAGLAGRLAGRAVERGALGGSVTGLAQTITRATVVIVGVLVLLSTLGIQITPILTALGVGGLAAALALQDTLANVFAGVHLLADRPIRVGDYVKVGDNGEGFVIDVGWRSTRIRSLANNVIIVPNQAVARATITNYALPEPRVGMGLKVSVEYSVDADHVEALLLDEATRAVGHVPGLLAVPAPSVSLIPGFGEYSLDFTVGYHVETFVDQYRVQHELRKRILHRLHRESISIAVPARAAWAGRD